MSDEGVPAPPEKGSSGRRLLIGLGLGVGLGLVANLTVGDSAALAWVVNNITGPIGAIFIRLLLMLVAPLLFAALVMGLAELELGKLGRIGMRMLVYTVVVSSIAVGIGLLLVNTFRPGVGLPEEVRAQARSSTSFGGDEPVKPHDQSAAEMIVSIVPDNVLGAASSNTGLLGLILFSVLFGIALAVTKTPGADKLRDVISGLYDVMMKLIGGVIALAPVGVGALLFSMLARLGFGVLAQLGAYLAVVLGALAIHMVVVYSLSVRFFGGMSPLRFFRGARLAIVTAFSTSSSNATLPTALKVADEELGLPQHVSRFVLTAGSAMNQNGTALYEGVTVLFLAQLFGVDLGLAEQALVMIICILGGIGTAGVPAGSLPVIAMILGMLSIPPEGIGLILGVDRFLDMCRTALNVTGDLAAAVYVAKGEPADAAP